MVQRKAASRGEDGGVDAGASSAPERDPKRLGYELETFTETLNEALERAQANLAALNYGVEARVELARDENTGRRLYLAFRKTDAGWLLMVEQSDANGVGDSTPVLSSSRERRALAGKFVPKLVAELTESTRKRIAMVREAVESVETFNELFPREDQ